MRAMLGRTVAASGVGVALLVAVVVGVADADTPTDATCDTTTTTTTVAGAETDPSTTTTTTTTVAGAETDPSTTTTTTTTVAGAETDPCPSTTTSTTSSTTTTTTTTTQPPLLVVEIPDPIAAAPVRGEAIQVAETMPPPTTTTTTTVPVPPEWMLPAGSGEGRRVVYRKTYPMRVWAVEADGTVAKTHLVSGRATWNQPSPGTYSVFSRSAFTCNIDNPHICWRYMVRFTRGPGGDNIGFHEIPTNNRTGARLQSESQLGLALSGGCVRQATPDAQWMWDWAPVGTKVVVLP